MPEPSSDLADSGPASRPGLTVRLGPVRGPGRGPQRGFMEPEELRAVAIYLNAGRRHGWKKRLALLLNTPETTIAAWASRSVGNTRPIPGAVAVAMRLMADLVRQAAAEGASHDDAVQAVWQRVSGLCPEPFRAARLPAVLEPVQTNAEVKLPQSRDQSILVEPAQPPSAAIIRSQSRPSA